MNVKIIATGSTFWQKFRKNWGIAFLIGENILFDTFSKPKILLSNMYKMGIDLERIKHIVISHDHWDHAGGLWKLLEQKKGLKVYSCLNFSLQFKKNVKQSHGILVELDRFMEIVKDVFVTGEIAGNYNSEYISEQALVVRTKKGLSVITGCAHPGIINILEKVKGKFPNEQIYSVFGGFHLMDKDKSSVKIIADKFRGMKIEKVGPTHCSGKEAEKIFKKEYGNKFITVKTGESLDV
ncbi:MAG: MBL fold metallo-hydrolase [PVC group bacterium]|nr:MBL fold metallo-hydrolase [PVC group bacterium]